MIFYRRRTPEEEIIEPRTFIAEGVRISSLARVKGHKENTILAWLRAAAQHAEQIEEMLMTEYHLDQGPRDAFWSYALWSYVGHKGKKRLPRNRGKGRVLAGNDDRAEYATACGPRDGQEGNRGRHRGVSKAETARPSRCPASDRFPWLRGHPRSDARSLREGVGIRRERATADQATV